MLYCDPRLGEAERWIIGDPRNALMRVPDDILHCVAFLCVKGREQYRYGGTGFFLAVDSESRAGFYSYFITAKHCVERAQQQYDKLYLRLNRRGERAELVEAATGWVFSEDADVAVLPFAPDPGIFEHIALSLEFAATDEVLRQYQIGIGDELIISGLFVHRHGRQRNVPILRSGIIASMPDEPLIDARTGEEYRAYLAEVRSIGGLSGSPVFAFLDPGRVMPGKGVVLSRRVYLLGLVRGHWDLETRGGPVEFTAEERTDVNTGMAIVTPIQDVLAIITGEEFVKGRREQDRERLKGIAPKEDSR